MKTKKYWILAATSAVCLAGVLAAKVFALSEKQLSLTEIKALCVFVQGVTEETKETGLTEKQIKRDVELKLKRAGIRVVSEEECSELAGSPVLYVNISARKRKQTAAFVYHVNIGLLQKVSLVRSPKIRIMSITWTKGQLGHCPAKSFVKSAQQTVGYLIERFLNDYRTANP